MSVLAVIPCLNEAAHLAALIEQMLGDQTIGLLVVADGGSTDGSRQIVQRIATQEDRLRLLDNPDRIQSAGVNRVVERHGGDFEWLLRIDAHCRYPDGYAAKLLAAATAHQATAVVVPMITVGLGGFQVAAAAAQNSALGTGGSPHRHVREGRFVDHGHHALMRMEMFRRLGGYCEAMTCNEDAELDRRQLEAGGRIWLEPGAAVTYFPRKTPSALARQYFRYGMGRARNLRRHRSRPRLRQVAPLAVPFALALALLSPLHWAFALPAAAWAILALAAGVLVGLRSGGGWALLSGFAAGVMHVAWGCGFLVEWLGKPQGVPPRYGLRA